MSIRVLVSLLLAAALLVGGCTALVQVRTTPPAPDLHPAGQAANHFYRWYQTRKGDPLEERAFRHSADLASEAIIRIDRLLDARAGKSAPDPILCGATRTAQVTVGEVRVGEAGAAVPVTLSGLPGPIQLLLVQRGEVWRITEILCP